MIPIISREFNNELETLMLESVKISAIPLTAKESLSIVQSKFLGVPYLPIDYDYPRDKKGRPMILIAQINFSEVPLIKDYPNDGILQIFISSTDWYDMDDFKVIYHDNINDEYQTDFSFLTEDLYEDSPIYCEHKLEYRRSIEYGGNKDHRFQLLFNGMGFYEFCETLLEDERKIVENFFDVSGHKIGGYAYFIQSDPRDYRDEIKNDVLLLQIDSDDKIMFGDNGIANLFIDSSDLKNNLLEKAWFNWDCF